MALPSGAPAITTIIPTYRRPALLRRALHSVLNQTYPSLRVCIYDNGADPETARIAAAPADPRISYHAHPRNLGSFANFQYGLQRVETPFFSFLSDDDVLLPDFYATAMAALEREADAMFAASQVLVVDDEARILTVHGWRWKPGLYRPPDGFLQMVQRGHIPWTGILFRRAVLEQVPAFDPEVGPIIDVDFAYQLASRSSFVMCDRPGAVLVLQAGSLSAQARLSDTLGWIKLIAKVRDEPALPISVRKHAAGTLDRQLAARIFRVGRVAARGGRVADVDEVADLLVGRYGRRLQALVLRTSVRLCAVNPLARDLLAGLLAGYRRLSSARIRHVLELETQRAGRKDVVTAALRSVAMDAGSAGVA